jgi:hypothetical protein
LRQREKSSLLKAKILSWITPNIKNELHVGLEHSVSQVLSEIFSRQEEFSEGLK